MRALSFLAILLATTGCEAMRTVKVSKPCKVVETTSSHGIVGAETSLSTSDLKSRATVGLFLEEVIDTKIFVSHCTGVVVAPQLVLTAAHCMDSKSPFREVSFDAKLPTENRISIVSFSVHPNWQGNVGNFDIAWIKLARPIPTSAAIAEVLPASNVADLIENMPVTLVGFGITGTNNSNAGVKRNTTTVFNRYVDLGFQDRIAISNSFVLGPTPNKMACSGDSGGPAFVQIADKLYVIGNTSGAPVINPETVCERGVGIWTAIHPFRDWIETTSKMKLGNPVPVVATPAPTVTPTVPPVTTPTPGTNTDLTAEGSRPTPANEGCQ